jgi:hypothetical protein
MGSREDRFRNFGQCLVDDIMENGKEDFYFFLDMSRSDKYNPRFTKYYEA